MLRPISVDQLHPHPGNPRLSAREDVITAIQTQLSSGGFDAAHALIVRPNGKGWQIISGHNRVEAARRAGLASVPCWVREMDDDEAFMLLVTANAQGELSPIERGMHALQAKIQQGIDIKAYAARVGRAKQQQTVFHEVWAAEVFDAVKNVFNELDRYLHLVVIHAAPAWLWPGLVDAMVVGGWTVEQTRTRVAALKDAPKASPPWALDDVPALMVGNQLSLRDLARIDDLVAKAREELADDDDLLKNLSELRFNALSDAMQACNRLSGLARERKRKVQKTKEEAEAKASRLREHVSLAEWHGLDPATRTALLSDTGVRTGFNKQDSASIEWAKWSWNPITGCEHNCPYCYARDIATSGKTARVFPNGFEPTLYPRRLMAPRSAMIPGSAHLDTRERNVFMGSMADVFGRWVPPEWIEAVLSEIRLARDWNFLCLTKFPKRMAEFDIPENAWMGTTVDMQARVNAAEAAFERIGAGIRWLSCEPLLEPLRFRHMDRFNWIVIGGASRSSQTPDWQPPFQWIVDLVSQARDNGLKVYFKTNLFSDSTPRILELPFDAPIVADEHAAPAVFHYLGKNGGT